MAKKSAADTAAQEDQQKTNAANTSATTDVDNTVPEVPVEDQAINAPVPSGPAATGTTVFTQQDPANPVRAEDIFDRIAKASPREDMRLILEELARACGLGEDSTDLPEGMSGGVSTATGRGGPTPFAPTDLTGNNKTNAQAVPVGADGKAVVDADGNLINPSAGDPLTTSVPATDADGNRIDPAGNKIDANGNPVDDQGNPLNAK